MCKGRGGMHLSVEGRHAPVKTGAECPDQRRGRMPVSMEGQNAGVNSGMPLSREGGMCV